MAASYDTPAIKLTEDDIGWHSTCALAFRPDNVANICPIDQGSRLTPQIHGTIEQVSADLQQDSTESVPYHLVRLKVDPDEMQSLGALSLKAGMPIDAFNQTTPRSPASYLLRPFSDQLNRAFREK